VRGGGNPWGWRTRGDVTKGG